MKKLSLLFFAILLFASCNSIVKKQFTEDDIAIIPKPKEMVLSKGSFTFNSNTKIILNESSQKSIVVDFMKQFKISSGIDIAISEKGEDRN